MQISFSNWSMVESFRVNAQGLVAEDRREREFSEKMSKPTILSEAALHSVCKTRVLHHLLHLSHANQDGKHNKVECSKHLLQLGKRCMNMRKETPLPL